MRAIASERDGTDERSLRTSIKTPISRPIAIDILQCGDLLFIRSSVSIVNRQAVPQMPGILLLETIAIWKHRQSYRATQFS